MATKRTYKDIWIAAITKEIQKQDLIISKSVYTKVIDKFIASEKVKYLRETRLRAKLLHGRHFIPTRFPSAEFLSLSLAFRNNKL